jgi:hypothetical protein
MDIEHAGLAIRTDIRIEVKFKKIVRTLALLPRVADLLGASYAWETIWLSAEPQGFVRLVGDGNVRWA